MSKGFETGTSPSASAPAANFGSLRREYLEKDETGYTPPPPGFCHQDGGAAFTFCGHRLSSLYRRPRLSHHGYQRVKGPIIFS